MITLKAEKRVNKNLRVLRDKNIVPDVLYGPKTENLNVQVDLTEFEKVYTQAGDSLLITLNLDGKDFFALIRGTQFAPLSGDPIHTDFFVPPLKEKVEVDVAVIFNGESLAVKNLGGSLVKHFSELPVRALPQSLPKHIDVDIGLLKTFDDKILVKDLNNIGDFEIIKNPDDVIASVNRPESIKVTNLEEDETEEVKKEEVKEKKEEK